MGQLSSSHCDYLMEISTKSDLKLLKFGAQEISLRQSQGVVCMEKRKEREREREKERK